MKRTPYKTKDGKRVPSVTTILGKALKGDPGGLMHWAWKLGIEGKDYREERGKAANIGTIAHAMVDALLNGRDPYIEAIETSETAENIAKAQNGFDAFQEWWDTSFDMKMIDTEVRMVSEVHRFGGTMDAVAWVGDTIIVLDWKTSKRLYPEYIAQVAAYRLLWNEGNPAKAEAASLVRFDKETAEFQHVALPKEVLDAGEEAFLHARRIYDLLPVMERAVAA